MNDGSQVQEQTNSGMINEQPEGEAFDDNDNPFSEN